MVSNPSAFPRPASEAHSHGMHSAQEGMTLRDYFAAKALPRVMQDGKSFYEIAEDAYDMAEAMLKVREK